VGVLGTAVTIVASIEVTEALKILAGRKEALLKKLVYVDVWSGAWSLFNLTKGKVPCPVCDERKFVHLEKREGTRVTSLCGQNAIQVCSPSKCAISLEDLSRRLAAVGEVRGNEYMVRFKTGDYEFSIFPDGRAIIKGAADISQAKTLFSKYIGM